MTDNRHQTQGRIQPSIDARGTSPWIDIMNRFKDSLTGTTCHVDTNFSSNIDQLYNDMLLIAPLTNTAIITDEKWRYPDSDTGINHYEEMLLLHPNLQNKDVIVVTHRYQNLKFGPRHWVVSYPIWFLINQYYQHPDLSIKPGGLKYGFSSLNRRPALHRLLLGNQLYQNSLLDQVIFTQGDEDPGSFLPYVNCIPGFEQFKQLLPIQVLDLNNKEYAYTPYEINHHAYTDAYCNIVTETESDRNVVNRGPVFNRGLPIMNHEIITEKSYKPFLSGQVPLFLACPGHMAYLKKLGFEVMEDLVPVRYDQMHTLDKINVILDIVGRGPKWIEQFYFEHLSEIRHNHELITSGRIVDWLINNIQQFIRN